MNFYTGIGSRETPNDVLALMRRHAEHLAVRGWTLRSGHAPGADLAFELGVIAAGGDAQIFLPWALFGPNGNEDPYTRGQNAPTITYFSGPSKTALRHAAEFHPAWDRLKQGGRKLMARNSHQVLGPSIDSPVLSKFIVCWTKGARGEGGTGQAIRIAKANNIPVFDLADAEVRARIERSIR